MSSKQNGFDNIVNMEKWILIVILSTVLQWAQSVDGRVSFLPIADGNHARFINFGENSELNNHIRQRRQLPKNNCPSDLQNCYDGTCIEADLMCDGTVNCPDGSDETQARCQNVKCGAHLFRCAYGACVAKSAKCNGTPECADKSDELHKDCMPPSNEPNNCRGDFQCKNGNCVPQEDTCDGVDNCKDGSDETITLCSSAYCPKYSVRCAYGACISKRSRCNNIVDCVDGSDEDDALCGRPPRATTKKPVTVTSTTTTTTYSPPIEIPPGGGGCPLPDQPNRGRYVVENLNGQMSPGTVVPPYTFLKYTCPKNYDLSPSDPVYCTEEGTWFTTPDCYRQCIMPTSYTVDFKCMKNQEQFECGEKVPFGTVVTFDCKKNHFYPGLKTKLTCKDSGSFDNAIPRCRAECGLEVSKGTAYAINAMDAKRGTFPWHVGLFRDDTRTGQWQNICGGTLVSNHLFISAAHCVYNSNTEKIYPAEEFSAAVGKLYRDWNNDEDDSLSYVQKSKVKTIHIPKYYGGDQQNQQHDIAVIEISQIFRLVDSVRPICLDLHNEDFNKFQLGHNQLGKVAGWGLKQEDGSPSEVLQTLNMPIIDYNVCKIELDKYDFRRYLTPDKICAGYLNGSALCRGDSGGGLVLPSKSFDQSERWYLRGIVSVGPSNPQKTSCNPNSYTAFTEVYKLKYFLLEKFAELNLELN